MAPCTKETDQTNPCLCDECKEARAEAAKSAVAAGGGNNGPNMMISTASAEMLAGVQFKPPEFLKDKSQYPGL